MIRKKGERGVFISVINRLANSKLFTQLNVGWFTLSKFSSHYRRSSPHSLNGLTCSCLKLGHISASTNSLLSETRSLLALCMESGRGVGIVARCQFSNPKFTLYKTSTTADLHNKWTRPYRPEKMTSLPYCQTRKRKASSENTLWLIKVQKEKLHVNLASRAASWSPSSLQPYLLLCDFLQNKRIL